MQYIYKEQSGVKNLTLNGDLYKYIVKVRRFNINERINLRNLKDNTLYIYKIIDISKKDIFLELIETKKDEKKEKKYFEIFWCIIDNKIVEKTLPLLNQIGVSKITFVYCDRSQKNFKFDFERLKKIIINSNQQSGRVDLMEFAISNSLKDIVENEKDLYILDFGGDCLIDKKVKKVLVGCEGGFSKSERELFNKNKKISFKTSHILKSETACVSLSSKVLL